MTSIYANNAFSRRMNASSVMIVVAILFGFWELWRALNPGPDGAGYGYLFAALFIGGGVYAIRQIRNDYSDNVVRLDGDGSSGRGVVTIWQPFMSKRIDGPLDRLTNWRFHEEEQKGNVRLPMLLAEHPDHPQPLKFELGGKIAISEELRALAPEAVSTFEAKALRTPGG